MHVNDLPIGKKGGYDGQIPLPIAHAAAPNPVLAVEKRRAAPRGCATSRGAGRRCIPAPGCHAGGEHDPGNDGLGVGAVAKLADALERAVHVRVAGRGRRYSAFKGRRAKGIRLFGV